MKTGPTLDMVMKSLRWRESYYDLYPTYSKPLDREQECLFESKSLALIEAREISSMFKKMPALIPVFRVIHVKDGNEPNLTHPGWSWSFEEQSALSFAKNYNVPKPWVMIKGFAPKSEVDWVQTLSLFSEFSGGSVQESENEIRVQGNKVQKLTWEWLKK